MYCALSAFLSEDPDKHWVIKVHYTSKIVHYLIFCKIILFFK